MNCTEFNLLAANEPNVLKMVFGVVFVALWAIVSAVSALQKKKEKSRLEQVRTEADKAQKTAPDWNVIAQTPPANVPLPPRPQPVRTPPLPRPAGGPARLPGAPPRPPATSRSANANKPPKKNKRPTPPPVPAPAALPKFADDPIAAFAHASSTSGSGAPSAQRAAPAIVAASDVAAWLAPSTLRQQFILTELLQPPVSLRPPREGL